MDTAIFSSACALLSDLIRGFEMTYSITTGDLAVIKMGELHGKCPPSLGSGS